MRECIVYGAGDFGYVVKNLVSKCGYKFTGFIDDFKKGEFVLGTYEEVSQSYSAWNYTIVIAVGYKSLKTRWEIYQKVKADGYMVVNLVHPQAVVDKSVKLGEGVIIMAGAIVDYNAELKDLAVLWNGVVVSHDSIIKENTFLSPNSTICGNSIVGKNCFIGAGAVIPDHVVVLDDTFIKAGSVYVAK